MKWICYYDNCFSVSLWCYIKKIMSVSIRAMVRKFSLGEKWNGSTDSRDHYIFYLVKIFLPFTIYILFSVLVSLFYHHNAQNIAIVPAIHSSIARSVVSSGVEKARGGVFRFDSHFWPQFQLWYSGFSLIGPFFTTGRDFSRGADFFSSNWWLVTLQLVRQRKLRSFKGGFFTRRYYSRETNFFFWLPLPQQN